MTTDRVCRSQNAKSPSTANQDSETRTSTLCESQLVPKIISQMDEACVEIPQFASPVMHCRNDASSLEDPNLLPAAHPISIAQTPHRPRKRSQRDLLEGDVALEPWNCQSGFSNRFDRSKVNERVKAQRSNVLPSAHCGGGADISPPFRDTADFLNFLLAPRGFAHSNTRRARVRHCDREAPRSAPVGAKQRRNLSDPSALARR